MLSFCRHTSASFYDHQSCLKAKLLVNTLNNNRRSLCYHGNRKKAQWWPPTPMKHCGWCNPISLPTLTNYLFTIVTFISNESSTLYFSIFQYFLTAQFDSIRSQVSWDESSSLTLLSTQSVSYFQMFKESFHQKVVTLGFTSEPVGLVHGSLLKNVKNTSKPSLLDKWLVRSNYL